MGFEDAEIQSKIRCFKSYAHCRKQIVNLHCISIKIALTFTL